MVLLYGPVRKVVTFGVGRKGYMGTILLVCGGKERGWVTVLLMAWEYGASDRGRVRGGPWRESGLLGERWF